MIRSLRTGAALVTAALIPILLSTSAHSHDTPVEPRVQGPPPVEQPHWPSTCELYPERGRYEYEPPEWYVPDRFVANDPDDTGDHDEGERMDSVRNGLYQRWIWCGTGCWVLLNDVDREMVVFDGYVSKTTVGSDEDPYRFTSEELTRIQDLADFLRFLHETEGYALKGILIAHFHGDHTVDAPVLLRALRRVEGGSEITSYILDGDRTRYADHSPRYRNITSCIPVIVDESTSLGYVTAGGGDGNYNPATHYVLFDYPGCPGFGDCPGEHHMGFRTGQKFNISRALVDAEGQLRPCHGCTHGQFKLGHFEFNAYVWDHQFSNENRTFAFRVWHDRAPNARRTFFTGSAGEMTNGRSDDMFVSDHPEAHGHDLRGLLQRADDFFGDHADGFIWTDMLLLATKRLGSGAGTGTERVIETTGDNIRFYDRDRDPDGGSEPVGYVLATHHDSNGSTGTDWEEDYIDMLQTMDEDDRARYDDQSWQGQEGLVRVLGRQLNRLIFDNSADWWIGRYVDTRDSEEPSSAEVGGPDRDGDTVGDEDDNCPLTPNSDQADDSPADGTGDACQGHLPGCVDYFPNLLAWWRFDEFPIESWRHDDSAHEEGTSRGLAAFDHASAEEHSQTTPAVGMVNGALRFDGRRDWLEATPVARHHPENMTIAAWIRPDAVGPESGIIDWASSDETPNAPGEFHYALILRGDGELELFAKCDGGGVGSDQFYTIGANIEARTWVHLAVSHEQDVRTSPPRSGPLQFYVNGHPVPAWARRCDGAGTCEVLPASEVVWDVDLSGCASSEGSWVIGRRRTDSRDCGGATSSTGNCFDGKIDELQIHECALAPADVEAIAEAGSAGQCFPPSQSLEIAGVIIPGCRKAAVNSIKKLYDVTMGECTRCNRSRDAGRIDAATDCNDLGGLGGAGSTSRRATSADRIARVEARILETLNRRCAEIAPEEMGFRDCPEPCADVSSRAPARGSPLTTFAEVADCLSCTVRDAVSGLAREVLGNPLAPLPKFERRCHKDIADATTRRTRSIVTTERKALIATGRRAPACTPQVLGVDPDAPKIVSFFFEQLLKSKNCATADIVQLDACSSSGLSALAACTMDAADTTAVRLLQAATGLAAIAPDEASVCGDDVVSAALGEECDPPYARGGAPGCAADCTSRCGDGILQAKLGEECDSGALSDSQPDACRTDCRPAGCGDGVVDKGEQCDDGNREGSDRCTENCKVAVCGDGSVCADSSCTSGPGKGVEQCDPPYANGGLAGCDATCTDRCGNGILESALGEECDSGSANSDLAPDACRKDCTLPRCGDDAVDTGEQCDAGEISEKHEYACPRDCVLASCGDGFVCSDGSCLLKAGMVEECDPPYSRGGEVGCTDSCESTCGNGLVEAQNGEECDEGSQDGKSGESPTCDEDCTRAGCGDGVVNQARGEQCDDGGICQGGNSTGGQRCTLPAGDECPPDAVCVLFSGDGCSSACLVERCACVYGPKYGLACDPWEPIKDCYGAPCLCS